MEWKNILKYSNSEMKMALWMQQLLGMGYSFDHIEITNKFPLGRPTDVKTGRYRVFLWSDEEGHENFPFTQENPFYAPKHAKNPWADFSIHEGTDLIEIYYDRGDKNLFKEIEQLWGEIVNE